MSGRATSLAELRERALRERREAALLAPIDDACSGIEDAELAAIVRFVSERLGHATLGAMLASAEAERAVRKALSPGVRERLLGTLETFLFASEGHALRIAVKPQAPRVPEPPRLSRDLESWAERYGVVDCFDRPATATLPFVESGAHLTKQPFEPGATLHDVLHRRRLPSSASSATALADAARQLLHQEAERRALEAERRARWETPPASVSLRRTARALLDRRAQLAAQLESSRPVVERLARVEIVPAERRFSAHFVPPSRAESKRPVDAHVRLGTDGFAVECSVCQGPSCIHRVEVLAVTLDALHERGHALHAGLATMIERGRGSTLEDAVSALVKPAKDVAARTVGYRLEAAGDRLSVVPVLRKRNKDGSVSAGSVTTWARLLEDPAGLDAREVEVVALGALATQRPDDAAVAGALLGAVLASGKVGDPDDPRRTATVREGVVTLALEVDGDEATLGFAIDGMRVAHAKVERGGRVVERDDIRATYVHGLVDPRLASLAKALGDGARESLDTLDASLDKLLSARPPIPVVVPAALAGERVPVDVRLVLRVEPIGRGGLQLTLHAQPLSHGPTYTPGEGPTFVVAVDGGRRVHGERDLEDERNREERIRAELDWPYGSRALRHPDPDHALDVLGRLSLLGDSVRVEWPEGKRPFRVARSGAAGIAVRVHEAGRWLGVTGDIASEAGQVPLSLVLAAIRERRRFVALSEDTFVEIEDALRERLAGALGDAFEEDGTVVLSRGDLAAVEAQLGAAAVHFDTSVRKLADRVEIARERVASAVPRLGVELRGYQEAGFRFMQRLSAMGLGALLADEMGLGKTLQTLALLADRAALGPAIVVAPTSVVDVWMTEARRYAPGLAFAAHLGNRRANGVQKLGPGDVLVTSYEVLARDVELLTAEKYATAIFDEAHFLKNPKTRRAEAARMVDADARIGLTGTPVENHLGDLFGVFDVVLPGLLGNASHFRDRYAGASARFGDVQARDALRARVAPYVLRRTKAEVAIELPPRIEVERVVEPSAEESLLYEAVRREAVLELGRTEGTLAKRRFAVLAALTRLRQLACHPRLVDPSSAIASSKLESFIELARDLAREGRRALVFSQFVRLLDLVREALDSAGLDSLRLDGGTPAKERGDLVRRFQEGNVPFFLISLRAGGTGLNLTAADYVIHLDPWWNPAVEDQASDRAHRIGQTHPVTVVRMVTSGTIERAVLELHHRKRALADALLAESSRVAATDLDELIALISVDAQTPR